MRNIFQRILLLASCSLVLLAISMCKGPVGPRGPEGSAVLDTLIIRDTVIRKDTVIIQDTLYLTGNWAKVLDSIKTCSYMIGLRNEANGELILVGSGSSVSQNTIITNAHVYIGLLSQYIILKQLGNNVTPIAVQNGSAAYGSGVYTLDIGGIHNGYADSTVFTYDIGFFVTTSPMAKHVNLPTNDTIQKIKVGQDIGTLGFPGETADRITRIATSTFKNGVISSLSPFNSGDFPTVYNTYVIQHNFNTTSGTSGSPIFDMFGRLVGVNNSGAVKAVWNDATSNFTFIPVGSIGYGIRSDVVNDMFANSRIYRDTISTWPIPALYSYYFGSRICLRSGIKPVYMGTTMATARTAANALFGKAAPDFIFTDSSIYYTDNISYRVEIMKDPSAADNVWAIWISDCGSKIYLPSFRDYWGITIGTSRTFILNTYGYGYTNSFSTDSSMYYYDYSSLGIGFGFTLSDGDWNCDAIQIAQSGRLQKRTSKAAIALQFPNLGKSDLKTPKRPVMKSIPVKVLKKFR